MSRRDQKEPLSWISKAKKTIKTSKKKLKVSNIFEFSIYMIQNT